MLTRLPALLAFLILCLFPCVGRAQVTQVLPSPIPPPKPQCDSYSMQSLPTVTFKQRACFYRDQLLTGTAFSGAAFWGFVAELRHTPPEWPQGLQGFGEQFGTRYAQGMAKSTGTFVVGALLHEDPRTLSPLDVSCENESDHYRPVKFWPRLGRSLARVVITHNASCQNRFAFSRIAGSFSSGFVSLAWAPPSNNHISNTLEGSGTALAGYFGNSVFTEFQGDLFGLLGHLFPTGKPKATSLGGAK